MSENIKHKKLRVQQKPISNRYNKVTFNILWNGGLAFSGLLEQHQIAGFNSLIPIFRAIFIIAGHQNT